MGKEDYSGLKTYYFNIYSVSQGRMNGHSICSHRAETALFRKYHDIYGIESTKTMIYLDLKRKAPIFANASKGTHAL